MGEVLKMLPPERHCLFVVKRNELEAQLSTLRHLTTTLPQDPQERLQFSRHFQGSRNPGELFTHLVANSCFSAAEGLWNSQLRSQILPDIAVKAVIGIGTNADPNTFIGMLEEFIIPSLDGNFALLPLLWLWSCRLADDMDDNGDLPKAIDLLQVSFNVLSSFLCFFTDSFRMTLRTNLASQWSAPRTSSSFVFTLRSQPIRHSSIGNRLNESRELWLRLPETQNLAIQVFPPLRKCCSHHHNLLKSCEVPTIPACLAQLFWNLAK
jgi:hypothetical protein